MLYALSIKPLLCKLRAQLSGLTISCCLKCYVVSAYANDIIVFINCQTDITNLGEAVTSFNKLSFVKVNRNKSKSLAMVQGADITRDLQTIFCRMVKA